MSEFIKLKGYGSLAKAEGAIEGMFNDGEYLERGFQLLRAAGFGDVEVLLVSGLDVVKTSVVRSVGVDPVEEFELERRWVPGDFESLEARNLIPCGHPGDPESYLLVMLASDTDGMPIPSCVAYGARRVHVGEHQEKVGNGLVVNQRALDALTESLKK